MKDLQTYTENYLLYCKEQKRLDLKTIKAYKIDLNQFTNQIELTNISENSHRDYPHKINYNLFDLINFLLKLAIYSN